MKFGRQVVDNSKSENEKRTQKRQFCDFAPENVYYFWTGIANKKTNCY